MEKREDANSILPFLPLIYSSSSLLWLWPSPVVKVFKAISNGPDHSRVNSGESLFLAISDIRNSLSLSSHPLVPSAPHGYALFFDDLMLRADSAKWFAHILPKMAELLLRLPALLASHYKDADSILEGVPTGLRILKQQHPGIVFLSQELIAALLTCSFFCLFPTSNRGAEDLPLINFDQLFEIVYENYSERMEHKIKCITNYFERISFCMPSGRVSFERKVLPLAPCPQEVSFPGVNMWSKSDVPLCRFLVYNSGLIEDQSSEGLEVDFANRYFGGGALRSGCVQEEIRFMTNPELIAGMLFLASMADNEAIEIVGTERFSDYVGYAHTFRFSGAHIDQKKVDRFGRRETRLIAIDALCSPQMRQYELKFILREINKAFCGFLDQSKYQNFLRISQDCAHGTCGYPSDKDVVSGTSHWVKGGYMDNQDAVGIVTGNWGCGAFGGDPELKMVVQWLAASEAMRPFIAYYTFGLAALQSLEQVTQWILSHKWTVGDLWHMLIEYSFQRISCDTDVGFLTWLVPSMSTNGDFMDMD
uniref:poly(ADP-ribose) glycohydrolase n=1 Tax=Kalanchoe fedtschenkoi TaxID=63787 RepID=A0A7N0TPR5_KALFE